jgi:hypothetical protein
VSSDKDRRLRSGAISVFGMVFTKKWWTLIEDNAVAQDGITVPLPCYGHSAYRSERLSNRSMGTNW